MNIEQARKTVAAYIADLSTEKICSILAFAEDSRMDYWNPCCCLIGVGSAGVLHNCRPANCPEAGHYMKHYISDVERAYYWIGVPQGDIDVIGERRESQLDRDWELIAILRAELERRPPLVIEISELDAVELEEACA